MCVCTFELITSMHSSSPSQNSYKLNKIEDKTFPFCMTPVFFLDQVLSYTVSRVKSAKSVLIMHNNVILYFILLLHLNIIPFKQTTQTKCI